MARKTDSSFSDLLFDNDVGEDGGAVTMRLSEIEPNENQPRKKFDEKSLKQLAESITEHGVIQPLIVRSSGGSYKIIAGERRWRAAKMAGLKEVPVVIRDDLTEQQAKQIALIENIQREDLNPIEVAKAYKELIDEYEMTQDELAKAVGKARSSITNSVGMLSLPEEVQALLADGRLSAGHCKVLKGFRDEDAMIEAARIIAEGDYSVRQVEMIARNAEMRHEKKKRRKQIKRRSQYYMEIEANLSRIIGTRVTIIEGARKNKLAIEFADADELGVILDRFFSDFTEEF